MVKVGDKVRLLSDEYPGHGLVKGAITKVNYPEDGDGIIGVEALFFCSKCEYDDPYWWISKELLEVI